jgi:hypothetical protein
MSDVVLFLAGCAGLCLTFGVLAYLADRPTSEWDEWADGTWDDPRT